MRQMILTGIAVLFALTGSEIAQAQITSMSNCGPQDWDSQIDDALRPPLKGNSALLRLNMKAACRGRLSAKELDAVVTYYANTGAALHAANLLERHMLNDGSLRTVENYHRLTTMLENTSERERYRDALLLASLDLPFASEHEPFLFALVDAEECDAGARAKSSRYRVYSELFLLSLTECYLDKVEQSLNRSDSQSDIEVRYRAKYLDDARLVIVENSLARSKSADAQRIVGRAKNLYDTYHPHSRNFRGNIELATSPELKACFVLIQQAYAQAQKTPASFALSERHAERCSKHIARYDEVQAKRKIMKEPPQPPPP